MPDFNDRRPKRPEGSGGAPKEHDPFVVDTRRTPGNRRAVPPRRPADDEATRIPTRKPASRPSTPGTPQAPRNQPPASTPAGRAPAPRTQDPRGQSARPSDNRHGDGVPARPAASARDASSRPGRPGHPNDGGDGLRYDPASGAYIGGAGLIHSEATRPASGSQPLRGAVPGGPRGPQGPGGPGRPGGPNRPDDGAAGGADEAPQPGSKRRFGRKKKILAGVLALFLLWVAGLGWAAHSAWSKVDKVDALPAHLADDTAGTNVLLVGSDGRQGLTPEQKRRLGTGNAEGQRTDSIMVLHMGGGKPTLMSIPRDSYVSIPGHAKNKINAAFSLGGPQLLIKTIEQNTGIHIDHYMEIGFAGFASVVDSVGGVHICVARDMNDKKAHINLKKGCQTLDGPTALGYVRARYSDPEGDIGRAKRQRQFLGALMSKVSSPTNLLLPWRLKNLGESGAQGLAVDKDMSMMTAARTMWTLKGMTKGGNSVVVPLSNLALPTPVGEAVEWDPTKSEELFKAIRENGDTSPFIVKTSQAATPSG